MAMPIRWLLCIRVWIWRKLLSLATSLVWPLSRGLKPAVFLLALVPLALMVVQILQNNLGPDPAQELAKVTGEWTIRFLLLALALTPLRHLTGITQLSGIAGCSVCSRCFTPRFTCWFG